MVRLTGYEQGLNYPDWCNWCNDCACQRGGICLRLVVAPRSADFHICFVAKPGERQIVQVFPITGDVSVSAGLALRGPLQHDTIWSENIFFFSTVFPPSTLIHAATCGNCFFFLFWWYRFLNVSIHTQHPVYQHLRKHMPSVKASRCLMIIWGSVGTAALLPPCSNP